MQHSVIFSLHIVQLLCFSALTLSPATVENISVFTLSTGFLWIFLHYAHVISTIFFERCYTDDTQLYSTYSCFFFSFKNAALTDTWYFSRLRPRSWMSTLNVSSSILTRLSRQPCPLLSITVHIATMPPVKTNKCRASTTVVDKEVRPADFLSGWKRHRLKAFHLSGPASGLCSLQEFHPSWIWFFSHLCEMCIIC